MFDFEYMWVFLLAPAPWLLRALLPARRVQQVSVRVPFGDRLAGAAGRAGVTQAVSAPIKSFLVVTRAQRRGAPSMG